MNFCYILYSAKLDKYDIGSTSNIKGRLRCHNSSNKGFTSAGKPWELKYFEEFTDKTLAIERELLLKKYKSRDYLEEPIEGK